MTNTRRLTLIPLVVLLLPACGSDHYHLDDFADDLVAAIEADGSATLRDFFKYDRDHTAFSAALDELRAAGYAVVDYCEIDSNANTLAVHFVENGDLDDPARLELRLFYGEKGYYIQDSAIDW
ncbi:MAG: hypothetical protein GF403_10310 [Candidatus Coatesbacteria bacterium]|nr:hypothetical protein [Candidatus Coatesbacteria bacterium]